ncbi:MAG: Smr/MutS family protein [Myxococcales bacterium]|nr:Smr/MutS family protein [Myxococcales bacterium]
MEGAVPMVVAVGACYFIGVGRRDDPSTSLGERLGQGAISAMTEVARKVEREAEAARAAEAAALEAALVPIRLDEAELMELIFANLDHENPRVCEGIDFDRLCIFTERPAVEGEPREDEAVAEPVELADVPALAEERQLDPGLDPRAWIGAGWRDDIRPIPAAVLDRPELEPSQRELLVRAGGQRLQSCNLRRMKREPAMAQLAFFVEICRVRGQRYCRVIPGKGVESRAEPVLKRALLSWCRAPEQRAVLGWAPEIDEHGEWGSAVLELRAAGR